MNLIKISHIVTRFVKGNGLQVVGIYEEGSFSASNFAAVYGYARYNLEKVKEPTFAEIKFDSEDGSKYYVIRTQVQLAAEKLAVEKEAKELEEKAIAEKATLQDYILSEEERINKIVSDPASLVQIKHSDLTAAWGRLEMRSYNDPDKPYVNDWVDMFKTVSIYGHVIPVVDSDTIFK